MADETPVRRPVRDSEARVDPRFGRRPVKLSVHPAHPASARESLREDRGAIDRPSVGRSMRRALYRFVLAVLVGVSGTLGWQSYGEQMLAAHAPSLAWLFSISASKAPGTAATSSDPTQLAPVASNLDAVRRSLEQLATRQEQMAQDIAALQALEDDIRQKMSFMPPSLATVPPVTSAPQPKPPQARVQPPSPQPSTLQTQPTVRPLSAGSR